MIAHRCVLNMSAIIFSDWEWPQDIRYLASTPITHAGGVNIFPTLMRGGFVRVLPGFDIETFCRTIEAEKINAAMLVPTMIYALIDAKDIRARYDLASLETIIYGAAPMSPDRLLEGIAIFGDVFVAVLRPDRGRRNASRRCARSTTTLPIPGGSARADAQIRWSR